MDAGSYLNPETMKAQCDKAIRNLEKDNESLDTVNKSLDTFINNTDIQSSAFDTLKQQLSDYKSITKAMNTANDSDIADYETLKGAVGDEVLDGDVILTNKINSGESWQIDEETSERYHDMSLREENEIVSAYYQMKEWYYSNLADVNRRLYEKWQEKEDRYDAIETATRELFSSSEGLRAAIDAGISDMAGAFRGGAYVPNMSAPWRGDIEQEQKRIEIVKKYGVKRPVGMTNEDWEAYQNIVADQILILKGQGWPGESLQKYVDYINENVADEYLGKRKFEELKKCNEETQIVGSDIFMSMWNVWETKGKKEARKKLETLMDVIGMEELTGEAEQTGRLLEHIDKELAPHDEFWTGLAKLVQEGFPDGLKKTDKPELSRNIHQFRYVIDAQQVEYVRKNYEGATDEDKLAAYARKLGVYPFDPLDLQDWTTKESDRLHQKYRMEDGQIVYPDGSTGPNIKITFNEKFHSEFILNKDGKFLYILNPEKDPNGIVNGASFNYANDNDSKHEALDVH